MSDELISLDDWVRHLEALDVPVLARTRNELAGIAARGDEADARDISEAALHDALFGLRVMRDLQARHQTVWSVEITTVEHAVLMLGIDPFFAHYRELPVLDDMPLAGATAVQAVRRVLHRAYRAAMYARDWAAIRSDMHCDELAVAALLNEVGEALAWLIAPQRAAQVLEASSGEEHKLPESAQRSLLGFTYRDLVQRMARSWSLPGALQRLMFDHSALHPRPQLVALAGALSREPESGWESDAAMACLHEVSRLVGLGVETLCDRTLAVAVRAAAANDWYEDPSTA